MKRNILKTIELLGIICMFFVVLLFLTGVATHIYFASKITSKSRIMNSNNTGIVMTDRNNVPFFTFYEGKKRAPVTLSEISPNIQHAVIAVEDKEFYSHQGISLRGIMRSLAVDIGQKKLAYGGSTITQQLVKNALLTSSKSFLRKYQEMILAYEIEKKYTKDEILEMYLNSVYFGEGAFGVEEAAQTYFGKDAKNLTISESSLLAGLLPAPSVLSPYAGNMASTKQHQKTVLKDMEQMKFITSQESKDAAKKQLRFQKNETVINTTAPHFALMVRDLLQKKYSEEEIARLGLTVKTTLDLELQNYAEDTVRTNVHNLTSHTVSNAAAVVMKPDTREVLALVGSVDWENSLFGKVNMTTAPRQPGSSFKPIVYATAFDTRVITASTLLDDVPTVFKQQGSPDYKPQDYDKKYRGRVTPRRALANSLNIPSVQVMAKLPIQDVLERAKNLKITSLKDKQNYGLSLVLGTGEIPLIQMVNAYAAFADEGKSKPYTIVQEIRTKDGNTIYNAKVQSEQVFSPETAYIITSILSDNRARSEVFGNSLTIPFPAAVKTGTTENYRDAWTIGYTPSVVVGVWVGNNDGTVMDQVAGSLGAAPIWKSLVTYYTQGKKIAEFKKPQTLKEVYVCADSGLKARTATTSARTEYYLAGTEPTGMCNTEASTSALLIPTP